MSEHSSAGPARDAVAALPADGAGSVARLGRRAAAFALDALASALVAALFLGPHHRSGPGGSLPGAWSLVPLVLDYVLGLTLLGQTLGMRLVAVHVIRTDRRAPIGPLRAIVRTVLLVLLIPAVIVDRANRGLHDRASDTLVVNSR